jgi:hypothetical protein
MQSNCIRPKKKETHGTRLTISGNLIDYPYDVSTPTADITAAKIVFSKQHRIPMPNAEFMGLDIKDFYLNTKMELYEYMRLPIDIIPQEIVDQYELLLLVHNGYVYIEIRKGMYGLPQAGIIANNKLRKHLSEFGYIPTKHTPGLWKHKTRPVQFSLVVDDFRVKYVGKDNALHLIDAIKALYECTTDWDGTLYCGITLKRDYLARTVDLSIPGYINSALDKFQHPLPSRPEHSPHAWNKTVFGQTTQQPFPEDSSNHLASTNILRIQQIGGTLLYYARAVDVTLLVALNSLAAEQSKGAENTAQAIIQVLNYCATHPDAMLLHHVSGTVLHIDSDASYLSMPKARSCIGGHHYLSSNSCDPSKAPTADPPPNGPIHTVCHKLRHVMASAAEAEVGGLFVNGQDAVQIRTTLKELNHPQPPSPIRNGQLNRFRHHKQHPQVTQIPLNGHALLLDSRLSQAKPIYHLLATRH